MEKRIIIYENHEGDFWTLMGKYFAFRDYAHEMGGWQFYTKKGSVWFILLVDNEVAGFCAIIQERNHIFFDNFYLLKQYRGNGLSKSLFKKRLEYAEKMNQEIRVITDNHIQIRRYQNAGFTHYGNRGRYLKFKKI